jgi:hypothetical protein
MSWKSKSGKLNSIETYNYLYLLDSKKSEVYFFYHALSRKKNPKTDNFEG